MLKWILGGIAVVGIIIAGLMYVAYSNLKSLAAEGPSSSITIMAPASRVFASIANGDSLAAWRAERGNIVASRRGPLSADDRLHVEMTRGGTRRVGATWVVRALIRDTLIAVDAVDDSTGVVMFTRRDSLVGMGDSTVLISTFAAPLMDSIRTKSAGGDSKVLGFASNMMIGGMRMQSQHELKALKAHIEGVAAAPGRP